MARKLTRSERLFEEFCATHRVGLDRLPVQQGKKQPDYRINVNNHVSVVEIKQINPNKDDEAFHRSLDRNRFVMGRRNPDAHSERVRNQIDKAAGQLAAYLEEAPGVPALIVLFDNAHNQYTDPYTIQTAMYGWERVLLGVSRSEALAVMDRGFGDRNNRTMRDDNNAHVSAVVTLHERWIPTTKERDVVLRFYHNRFAKIRFIPELLRGNHVVHLELSQKVDRQFQNWVEL